MMLQRCGSEDAFFTLGWCYLDSLRPDKEDFDGLILIDIWLLTSRCQPTLFFCRLFSRLFCHHSLLTKVQGESRR